MSKYAEEGSKAWWGFVIKHKDTLINIVKSYHPSYGRNYSKNITASSTEAARQDFVAEIEREGPVDFEKAIKDKDVEEVLSILNQTWFGVPESTDCWDIPGFRELCTICECGVLDESFLGGSELVE